MKIPANAQDVSYDTTLPPETVRSCNSHYSTRMHNNAYSRVWRRTCSWGEKRKFYTLTEVCSCKRAQFCRPSLCFAYKYLAKYSGSLQSGSSLQAALQERHCAGRPRAASLSGTLTQSCCIAVCAFDALSGEKAQLSLLRAGLSHVSTGTRLPLHF